MMNEDDLKKIIKSNMKKGYAGTGDSPYTQEFVDELYDKKKSEKKE